MRDGAVAASIAMLAYVNTLPNGFVFDDHPAIQQNPSVQLADGWSTVLRTDFWGTAVGSSRSHGSYRPLAVLTLWLNRSLDADGGARSFHATNVVLHGIATWLLWCHAAAALRQRSSAFAAALLFAVHPVNSEAAAYCVGRADLLGAVLGLAALRAHARAAACERAWAACLLRLASLALLVLALASKETALVLLPACALWDVLVAPPPPPSPSSQPSPRAASRSAVWRLAARWLPLLCALLGFVWVRLRVAGTLQHRFRRLDNPVPFLGSRLARVLTYARIHAAGLRLLVWPEPLSCDYSHDALPPVTSVGSADNLPAALLYATLVVVSALLTRAAAPRPLCRRLLGLRTWPPQAEGEEAAEAAAAAAARETEAAEERGARRARVWLWWWLLLLLAYAPSSHALLPLSFVVAERLLYVPCAAACVLVAAAHAALRRRGGARGRWVARALLGASLAGGGARTLRRNLAWRDDATLFGAAHAAYPSSAKAIYQLGDTAVQRGETGAALGHFERALRIEPAYHYAYLHLARLALHRGEAAQAVRHARASLRAVAAPNPHAHALASRALLLLPSREAEAEVHARAALGADAGPLPAAERHASLNGLADALSRQQRWAEAAVALRAAAAARPADAASHVNLGAALLKQRRPAEAEAPFRAAVALTGGGGDGGGGGGGGVAENAVRGLRVAREMLGTAPVRS